MDAGSCNGCELEIHALNNAFYDLERFGLRFVASPRHADVLLVTGPVTKNMREALERTYAATPDPKWVVAVGDCALDGGMFAGSYAVRRRRLGRGAGRPPHPRLPADAHRAAEGPDRAGGVNRGLDQLALITATLVRNLPWVRGSNAGLLRVMSTHSGDQVGTAGIAAASKTSQSCATRDACTAAKFSFPSPAREGLSANCA